MGEYEEHIKKEHSKLEKENESLRKKIDDIIGINYPNYSPLWVAINELVDNEIEQEKFCNQ